MRLLRVSRHLWVSKNNNIYFILDRHKIVDTCAIFAVFSTVADYDHIWSTKPPCSHFHPENIPAHKVRFLHLKLAFRRNLPRRDKFIIIVVGKCKISLFAKIESLPVNQFWPYFLTKPPRRHLPLKCGWEFRFKKTFTARRNSTKTLKKREF